MARRKRAPEVVEHENDERWLLTYSDMITLLLALFIVLFSMSTINATKFHIVSQSLAQAFNVEIKGTTILNPGHANEKTVFDTTDAITSLQQANEQQKNENTQLKDQVSQLKQTISTSPNILNAQQAKAFVAAQKQIERLRERLLALVKDSSTLRSQVTVKVDGRGLVLRVLPDKVLFESGSAQLRPAASTLLNPLAAILRIEPNSVRVEGHTDNVPIHTSEFPSNWELSSARAASVVRYLIQHGVTSKHLSAAGFADTQPVAPNTTSSGRAKNRRIEIIVLRHTPDSGTYETTH